MGAGAKYNSRPQVWRCRFHALSPGNCILARTAATSG